MKSTQRVITGRMKSLGVAILVVLAFAGCARKTADGETAAEAAANALTKAELIASQQSQWDAYEFLSRRIGMVDMELKPLTLRGYKSAFDEATDNRISAVLNRYHNNAIAAADGRAALAVWQRSEREPDFAKEYVPVILANADAPDQVGNGQLQLAAGRLIEDGLVTMRNADQARNHFQRAWLAGEAVVAFDLAKHYVRMSRVSDAYLWALRCFAPCERSEGVGLRALQGQLQPSEVARIEVIAANPKVLSVSSGDESAAASRQKKS